MLTAEMDAGLTGAVSPPRSVLDVITALALARGLDEVMEIVRRGARHLTGADGVTFVLRDGDDCVYADEDAISPLWKGQRFPLETCISGWAMLNRVPAVIEDIYADPRIPHDAYRITFVKSLAMVPVRREDPVAAIGAYWAQRHLPSPEEVEVLTAIANGAAVAMTNVALYTSLMAAKTAAERASEARARFFAAANHDLRQPFQAMRLSLDMLAGSVAEPHQRKAVELLDRSMAHAEGLLDQLLDVARLNRGMVARRESVALAPLLRTAAEDFAPLAAHKGLRLQVKVAKDLRVHSDPALLRRVLDNLLGNAIRYTETGGVLIGARRRDDKVVVEVWDTGIGIAPELQTLVFEEFFQVGNSARDRSQGIGLGLAIVSRLCRLLDHPLTLASRPGRGSVFRVEMAAEPPP